MRSQPALHNLIQCLVTSGNLTQNDKAGLKKSCLFFLFFFFFGHDPGHKRSQSTLSRSARAQKDGVSASLGLAPGATPITCAANCEARLMIKNSARPNKAKNSALSERHELPYGWRPDKGEGALCITKWQNPQEILGYTPKFRYVHINH